MKHIKNSHYPASRKKTKSSIIQEIDERNLSELNIEETAILFEELKIHQVELELQNDELKMAQQNLRQSEQNFADLFNFAPVGYVRLDEKARILQVNQTFAEMLGRSKQDIESKHLASFITEQDLALFNVRFPAFYKKPEDKAIELRFETLKKELFYVELKAHFFKAHYAESIDGNSDCLLVTISDITERKRMENELRLAAIVFESSNSGIMITDIESKILRVNHAFTAITGYEEEEVIGKTPRVLKSNRQGKNFYQCLWQKLTKEGFWRGEIWNRRKNGELYAEWLSINTVSNKFGQTSHYIAIFHDITERKQNEEKIEQLAHYDVLTQLPNRTLLNDRLKQAIIHASRYKKWLAVFFLDLDRFKTLNDSQGHTVGDLLLQSVSKRLNNCVRETDTVSRFGGDEFVIVLTDFPDEQSASIHSAEIANKILKELAKPFELINIRFMTSASIGFALFPKHGHSVAELIKNADTAMYHAKAQGRNNYQYYTEAMRFNSLSQSLLEIELHSALANQEFELFYQPQIDLHSNQLVAVEALIRWQHPSRGLISPSDFIPILEETGLINSVGEWILRTACMQLKHWHKHKYPELKISVNLSAKQFLHGDYLISMIENVLADVQLEARYLELEITETLMMQNLEDAISILQKLMNLGISISLDDFGTGYSSLTYLKMFPINILKIDASFIRDIPEDEDDKIIVKSIIAIAQQMELDIIAEGIEKQSQADFLKQQNCKILGQGYFYSKPVPSTKI